MYSNVDFTSFVPLCFKVIHQFCFFHPFVTDSAAIVVLATGHQIVSLCGSICEEEGSQLLILLLNIETFRLDLICAMIIQYTMFYMLLAQERSA